MQLRLCGDCCSAVGSFVNLLASVYTHCPYLSLTPCALSLGSSGLSTMFILCCCLLLTLRRQGRCTHLSHLAHRRGHGRFLGWSALGAHDLALPHNQPHYGSSHVWLLPGHLRDLYDRPGSNFRGAVGLVVVVCLMLSCLVKQVLDTNVLLFCSGRL